MNLVIWGREGGGTRYRAHQLPQQDHLDSHFHNSAPRRCSLADPRARASRCQSCSMDFCRWLFISQNFNYSKAAEPLLCLFNPESDFSPRRQLIDSLEAALCGVICTSSSVCDENESMSALENGMCDFQPVTST